MRWFKIPPVMAVLLALLVLSVRPVLAHGYIVRSIPENRVTLERPPARLQYWFSEGLEPAFSKISLRDQTGAILAEGAVAPDNRSLMALQVPADLPDGAYIVDLRPAFASDGHVIAETRVFFVGEEVGGVDGSSSGYEVIPLEVAWRAVLYVATMLLMGVFVLYTYVLLPAWGNPRYRAGLLPPRVMQRLNRIVGVGLVLVFVGNVIAILQQSMVFFNTGPQQVLTQGLWQVVRIGSRFGDVWTARMIMLVLMGGLWWLSIQWREERPDMVRAFWTANVWVGALMVGAFSVVSHAAGSVVEPWAAMVVDWLHTMAVGAWVGGLVALTLVLPVALQPYEGDSRRIALLAVLRRFSRLAVRALALVTVTGIYSVFNWAYQPSDLVQTNWGLSLWVKMALVAALLLIALVHFMAVNPARYTRWTSIMQRAGIGSLRLEAVFAVLVLASVGNLSATAVPEPVFLTQNVNVPHAEQDTGIYGATLTISPGGPGVNTFDVVVRKDGEALSDADVLVQLVDPEEDWRSAWQEALPVDAGLYVYAGDEISDEGRWLTLVDVTSAGETVRLAFDWDISFEASIPKTLSLGTVHIAALLGVVLVILWLLYPLGRRLYLWLDWRPLGVIVAVLAIAISTGAIIVSARLVQEGVERYDETLNPPPAVVNPVLPDAASLAEGRQLYSANCIEWQAYPKDFNALRERVELVRDEVLFFATRDGWRSLPACTGDLTDTERWHIVNFFRTLA